MPRLTIQDLEIERRSDPFVFETSDGREFVFADPKSLPLTTILAIQSLPRVDQLKSIMSEDEFNELKNHPEVDGYVFDALVTKWVQHYAVGEARASSR